MNNFEGYTIVSVDGTEELDVSALDEFLARHADNIRSIDDEALERAARNLVRPIQKARRPGVTVGPLRRRIAATAPRAAPVPGFEHVLIARVPAAGGRWAQVHFNADVVRDYFRITDHQTQRVYLTQVAANGDRGEVEVRPCVFSEINRNHKIEIRAASGQEVSRRRPTPIGFSRASIAGF